MILNKKNFFLNLNCNFLFENNPSIAVGVSGGPDSLALIYLMRIWIKSKKGNLIALIIDHKLRDESYTESRLTRDYLTSLNIKSKIIRVSDKKLNKRNMNEARNNRFNKLINYCQKNNILHLFLGHHFDDNIETFLIRKLAGSNLEGLSAMQFYITRKNIHIMRPLLNFSKKQIFNFNKTNKIKFIQDPSNIDEKYTRTNVRNFLSKTKALQSIINDYNQINFYAPFYQLMINETLIRIIVQLKRNLVTILLNDFNNLNKNVKVKIIEKIYSFFYRNNKKLRFSKVVLCLLKLNNYNIKSYNLSSMNIRKNEKFLDFSIIN